MGGRSDQEYRLRIREKERWSAHIREYEQTDVHISDGIAGGRSSLRRPKKMWEEF